jgi:hypothetical protein
MDFGGRAYLNSWNDQEESDALEIRSSKKEDGDRVGGRADRHRLAAHLVPGPRGRRGLPRGLAAAARPARWRVVPVRANGQLAFAHYRWDEERRIFSAPRLVVITLAGDEIAEITAFLDLDLMPHFGLPEELEA